MLIKEIICESSDSGNWYIRFKGKVLKDKSGDAIPFLSKDEAQYSALRLADKKHFSIKDIKLSQSWMDAPQLTEDEDTNPSIEDLKNVLLFLRGRAEDTGHDINYATNTILKLMQSRTGMDYSLAQLKQASQDPAIQNIIQNVTKDKVEFKSEDEVDLSDDGDMDDTPPDEGSPDDMQPDMGDDMAAPSSEEDQNTDMGNDMSSPGYDDQDGDFPKPSPKQTVSNMAKSATNRRI